jgi:hypothetical protein
MRPVAIWIARIVLASKVELPPIRSAGYEPRMIFTLELTGDKGIHR